MTRSSLRTASLLAIAMAGCGAADSGESSDELRGASAATGIEFAAVGALGVARGSAFSVTCTGTLVAPNKVITAKHCVTSDPEGKNLDKVEQGLSFLVGAKVSANAKRYRVTSASVPTAMEGGFIGYGSDVAMLTLETSVAGIAPLAISATVPRVGEKLAVVGFGFDETETKGERRKGSMTVRATEKQAARAVWSGRAAFEAFLVNAEGDKSALDPSDDRSAQAARFFDYALLAEHEVFVGLAPGDAQPCRSDSGGPLLRNGQVVGVVSGSLKLSSSPCGNYGAFFATFGPRAKSVM
jgi:hypothetical protein